MAGAPPTVISLITRDAYRGPDWSLTARQVRFTTRPLHQDVRPEPMHGEREHDNDAHLPWIELLTAHVALPVANGTRRGVVKDRVGLRAVELKHERGQAKAPQRPGMLKSFAGLLLRQHAQIIVAERL